MMIYLGVFLKTKNQIKMKLIWLNYLMNLISLIFFTKSTSIFYLYELHLGG